MIKCSLKKARMSIYSTLYAARLAQSILLFLIQEKGGGREDVQQQDSSFPKKQRSKQKSMQAPGEYG